MSLMIGLLIGIMVGVLLSRFIFREKPVGSLRVDESDPDSGPYLFLELDRSGADAIYKQRYVRLRVELKNYKVEFPSTEYIDTIKESGHVRHKYYGVGTEYTGTIFTELRDKTISDNSSFYENSTIDEAVNYLESDWALWLFWVIWIIVIGLCVFGFYYIDNEWLEN